jgi:pyrroloquinoline quinone (PQQ) biosynthesis protein C
MWGLVRGVNQQTANDHEQDRAREILRHSFDLLFVLLQELSSQERAANASYLVVNAC